MMTSDPRQHAIDLLRFIDLSPSPWHAVAEIERRLQNSGFQPLLETEGWSLQPGLAFYVVRGGSSLIAGRVGTANPATTGFRILCAHTDSPGLRVKPHAPAATGSMLRLGVELYGSPILATFADRELGLAGTVALRDGEGIAVRRVCLGEPLLRLPNLAIHLNRAVNEEGLKFNKQVELPLILAEARGEETARERLVALLAERLGCAGEAILSWELQVFDVQSGCLWGAEREFLANGQLDNLASCHAGMVALIESQASRHHRIAAFFDHEEVGSESRQGAAGSFLSDVLERLTLGCGDDLPGYRQALARSFLVSADGAHAFQPNFPDAYEPAHWVRVNQGPAVKLNANQRYASEPFAEARFTRICAIAKVPVQTYVHRTGLVCGSTVGPLSAARLGVATVDCGCPIWAMHSARESAGVFDQQWFADAIRTFYDLPELP